MSSCRSEISGTVQDHLLTVPDGRLQLRKSLQTLRGDLGNAMSIGSHIHVRPLEIVDFAFVQQLASKQANFTVPPTYILWLLLRIKGAICLLAEDSKNGSLGYLLAVPVEAPENSIFVWQLAVEKDPRREKAMLALLIKLRTLLRKLGVRTIGFSTVPKSATFRTIRKYSRRVFSTVPQAANAVAVDPAESEFLLMLGGSMPTDSMTAS